jgi:hypothetical protein
MLETVAIVVHSLPDGHLRHGLNPRLHLG